MKKKENNKNKQAKFTVKKIVATAALAGSLLISTPSAANAAEARPKGETIQHRVKAVKEALMRKLADSQHNEANLSYSETELTQWNNWRNWGNWGNWNNWNNWGNWGNWGNWRNF
jgi:hypothetical protein